MDAAYDVPAILEHSLSLGHVPLVDKNPRRNEELKSSLKQENLARKTLNLSYPETLRYNARSTAERANARLKEEFGACKVRVRGHAKVACHLLFGVLTALLKKSLVLLFPYLQFYSGVAIPCLPTLENAKKWRLLTRNAYMSKIKSSIFSTTPVLTLAADQLMRLVR